MRNYNEVYQRKYKKIQDVIGIIDGFLAIFLFICGIVHDFLYHDFLVMNDFNNILHVKVSNVEVNPYHSPNNKSKLKKGKIQIQKKIILVFSLKIFLLIMKNLPLKL